MQCLKTIYSHFKDRYLCEIEYADTIPFVPPVSQCKVIKVYDGDTITIGQKLPFKNSPIYRFSVRINGIDCPEIKTKDADEKECAQLAKQFVTKLILNEIVTLKNINTEKYGRILADVYYKKNNIKDLLLERHLAVEYDGGTKKIPTSWMEYHKSRGPSSLIFK